MKFSAAIAEINVWFNISLIMKECILRNIQFILNIIIGLDFKTKDEFADFIVRISPMPVIHCHCLKHFNDSHDGHIR